MEVDNFDRIKEHMDFSDPTKCYVVLLILRAKDNPPGTYYGVLTNKSYRKHKKTEIADNYTGKYFISSASDLDKFKPDIVQKCKMYHCRAYMSLWRRNLSDILYSISTNETASRMLSDINFELKNGYAKCVESAKIRYNAHVCQIVSMTPVVDNNTYGIDIDKGEIEYINEIREAIESENTECEFAEPGKRIIFEIPSKTGVHIVTYAFDDTYVQSIMKTLPCEKNYIGVHRPNYKNLFSLQDYRPRAHTDNGILLYCS